MATEPTTQEVIQRDFPQLDPALVYAILSDFSLPLSRQDEDSVRETLESLANSAEIEGDAQDRPVSTNTEEGRNDDVSEMSSALEESNLTDARGSESDAIAGIGEAGKRRAGQRFWDQSAASNTSEEGGGGAAASPDNCSPQPRTIDPFDFDPTIDGFDDPLAFLASVFPDIDVSVLESKISTARRQSDRKTPFPSQDLESLIEELLSQDLITSLIDDDSNAALLANPPPNFEAEAQMVLSKNQKRRLKQEQKSKTSFSLTANPGIPSSPAYQQLDPMIAAARGVTTSALSKAPSTSNAWASISSHASHLSSLLHVPATRISSLYYKNSASLPLTLAVLLKQLSHERPFEAIPFSTELSAQFRLIVPRATSEDEIQVLLSATDGDLSDAIDLKRFISDIEEDQGKVLAYNEMVAPFDPSLALASEGGHSRNSSAGSIEFSLVGTSRNGTPALGSRNTPLASSTKPYTSEECYALSDEYLEKRNNAFRTAARSFQRGGAGERGAAGYWAEVGREHEIERRKWAERAAKAVVTERRVKHDSNTVDLHGMTLAHSLKIVDENVNSWWANSRDVISPEPLRIITGIGRHSRNQTPILLPAVTKHLDKNGWRWKYDDSPYVVGALGPSKDARGAVKVIGVK
ncbi:uncharacterized protein JCM6883_001240 [Sporobolomyces salmoneus]|uniref:uncharacterized protein n=1 Tax=Sporobolomyces salmoneus TaxID=183962 RepID=UPI00317FABA5